MYDVSVCALVQSVAIATRRRTARTRWCKWRARGVRDFGRGTNEADAPVESTVASAKSNVSHSVFWHGRARMHARGAYTAPAPCIPARRLTTAPTFARWKEMMGTSMNLDVPGSEHVTPRFTNISRHTSLSRQICSIPGIGAGRTSKATLRPLRFQVFAFSATRTRPILDLNVL